MKKESEKVADYPECTKISAVSNKSRMIQEFIEWLNERGIVLAEYPKGCEHHKPYSSVQNSCGLGHRLDMFDCGAGCEDYGETVIGNLQSTHHTVERLLADFFEVDLVKAEEERRAMLDDLRKNE